MMHLAIIEKDPARMEIIKDWLLDYSRKKNCYFNAIKISVDKPADVIGKYADQLQIALISLDRATGSECGYALYEENPDCRIMYYRSEPCTLAPLLSSRPISFFLWPNGKEVFLQRFDEMCRDVIRTQTFHYETRSRKYLILKSDILYFQSDLRYVDIHVTKGENPRILAKLAEMESLAGETFVRIHKSYLVNAKHVLYLDKKNHHVLMSSGEHIPISDAQYENACERLRRIK